MPEMNELDRVVELMADELGALDTWAKEGGAIPLGFQKMTPAEIAKQWGKWDENQRMEFIKENGIDQALDIAEKSMKEGK